MLSLSDKLKSLGVQLGAQNLPKPPDRLPEAYPIEQVVQGRFHSTPYGPAFVVETTYTAHYCHGRVGLRVEGSRQPIAAWAGADCLAGKLAIELLLARITGQRTATEQLILPCPLIVRESSGPV